VRGPFRAVSSLKGGALSATSRWHFLPHFCGTFGAVSGAELTKREHFWHLRGSAHFAYVAHVDCDCCSATQRAIESAGQRCCTDCASFLTTDGMGNATVVGRLVLSHSIARV
jgi:hypothetical protein